MVSLRILLRSFSIPVNSGFWNIYLAANIQLLFTPRFQRIIVKIVQCEVRNKISVIQEKVCSTRFPVMSWRKMLETSGFVSSLFNRKYIYAVIYTIVFVGAARFVFNAYRGQP